MINMDFVIKPIKWEENLYCYYFKVEISNIINTSIIISSYKKSLFSDCLYYKVKFTNSKWLNFANESSDTYIRYGFKNLDDAKKWVEEVYKENLNIIICDTLMI